MYYVFNGTKYIFFKVFTFYLSTLQNLCHLTFTWVKQLNQYFYSSPECEYFCNVFPSSQLSKLNNCIDWLPALSKADNVFIDWLNGEIWAKSGSQPSTAQPRSNTLSCSSSCPRTMEGWSCWSPLTPSRSASAMRSQGPCWWIYSML